MGFTSAVEFVASSLDEQAVNPIVLVRAIALIKAKNLIFFILLKCWLLLNLIISRYMLLFCNGFQTTEVLLGILVAVGCSTAEAAEGFVFLAVEPEGDTQGVLGTLIVANSL